MTTTSGCVAITRRMASSPSRAVATTAMSGSASISCSSPRRTTGVIVHDGHRDLGGVGHGSASPMVTVSVSRSRARSPRPFIDGWWIRFISSLRHLGLTKYRGGIARVPWPILGQFGCPNGYVCRSDTHVCQERVSRSAVRGNGYTR